MDNRTTIQYHFFIDGIILVTFTNMEICDFHNYTDLQPTAVNWLSNLWVRLDFIVLCGNISSKFINLSLFREEIQIFDVNEMFPRNSLIYWLTSWGSCCWTQWFAFSMYFTMHSLLTYLVDGWTVALSRAVSLHPQIINVLHWTLVLGSRSGTYRMAAR